jgi:hypothetical protein
MIGNGSYQPFAEEGLTHIRMVPVDHATFAGFTVPTPLLFWFIEFFNSKYKTTQAAQTALPASLFQPVKDKFPPPAIHIPPPFDPRPHKAIYATLARLAT